MSVTERAWARYVNTYYQNFNAVYHPPGATEFMNYRGGSDCFAAINDGATGLDYAYGANLIAQNALHDEVQFLTWMFDPLPNIAEEGCVLESWSLHFRSKITSAGNGLSAAFFCMGFSITVVPTLGGAFNDNSFTYTPISAPAWFGPSTTGLQRNATVAKEFRRGQVSCQPSSLQTAGAGTIDACWIDVTYTNPSTPVVFPFKVPLRQLQTVPYPPLRQLQDGSR